MEQARLNRANAIRFDIQEITNKATKLFVRCQKIHRIGDDSMETGSARIVVVYRAADELDQLINPQGRRPGDFSDIQNADLDDDSRVALLSLRERFDRCFHIQVFLDAKEHVAKSRVEAVDTRLLVTCYDWAPTLEPAVRELRESVSQESADSGDLPDGYYSAKHLAVTFGLPYNALRKRLEKWRLKNPDGDWAEFADPKSKQPRIVHHSSAVRHITEEMQREKGASTKRPSK